MKQSLRISKTIDLNEFSSVVRGAARKEFSTHAKGICLDTRDIQPGDLFFAIQSARDGHEFVHQAIEKGALACVVSRDMNIEQQIIVPNTLQCLWNYAGWVRKKWGKKIVALSGSNGKTTTKEMIATLLGDQVLKTPGTWNNFLGVPLTLLMLEERHKYGVIEMGINHFGELLQLCKFTNPDIALLTNIGTAHLQELHDLDGVAKAKSEIFSQLQPNNTAVLNIDDPKITEMRPNIKAEILTVSQSQKADIFLKEKKKSPTGHRLTIEYGLDEIHLELPVLGEHNISNFLCATGVCKALDVPFDRIQQRAQDIHQVQMRMQTLEFSENRKIVNDCYNANPGSFRAALQTVSEMKPKRFLVLMADMLEMGTQSNEIHHDFAKNFSKYGVDHVYVTGDFALDTAKGAGEGGLKKDQITVLEKKMDAVEKILSNFRAGDILLVKASRGMKLEEVVEQIERRLKG